MNSESFNLFDDPLGLDLSAGGRGVPLVFVPEVLFSVEALIVDFLVDLQRVQGFDVFEVLFPVEEETGLSFFCEGIS